MNPPHAHAPRWATTASPEPGPALPTEIDGLGQHFQQCLALFSPWKALCDGAGLLRGVVAARAITVALAVAVMGGLAWLLL